MKHFILLILLISLPLSALADGQKKLHKLSLDELMDFEVTSVSKKPQKISETAAAVFVITSDDIRRSGATSIPEALRMAPGIQVARLSNSKWAISSRGFNGQFANKLLVLIDGRSVYTTLFAGVYWDEKDVLLEDVDRIEVIRGPGGTIWGANAVNGIINIITKSAKETTGLLATAGGGNQELGFYGLRYGAKIGEEHAARLYTKFFSRDETTRPDHQGSGDDWRAFQGGFRLDGNLDEANSYTLHGDIYFGNEDYQGTTFSSEPPFAKTFDEELDYGGGNILAKWERSLSESSDMSLQFYYDRTERDDEVAKQHTDTLDAEFQHRNRIGDVHELIWGANYRFISDNIKSKLIFSEVLPQHRDSHLVSGFIQDEIEIIENVLYFTLGSKLEHNDYSGVEVQPSARAIWKPADKHSVWISSSRAIRSPSRVADDASIGFAVIPAMETMSLPTVLSLQGSHSFQSEELIAYEAGYRVQASESFAIDVAAFINDYDNISSFSRLEPGLKIGQIPHINLPFTFTNHTTALAIGIEVSADLRINEAWRLKGTYSFLDVDIDEGGDSLTGGDLNEESNGDAPQHSASLRSLLNLPGGFELDLTGRYVDRISALDIDSYLELDARIGWKVNQNLELSIVGTNLLDEQHQEFTSGLPLAISTEIERSIYGKLTLTY